MKLSWVVFTVLLAGCASSQKVASAPVSTTQVTSAEIGEANAPLPRVGKAQHSDETLEAADDEAPKRPHAPKKGGVFGWK